MACVTGQSLWASNRVLRDATSALREDTSDWSCWLILCISSALLSSNCIHVFLFSRHLIAAALWKQQYYYVISLHINIHHIPGLSVLQKFLSLHPPNTYNTVQFLITLAHFILTHNKFTFDFHDYLYVKDTTMKLRMTLSNANLLMGSLEETS